MRISLGVFERPGRRRAALDRLLETLHLAAEEAPDLVVFSEAAITGLDLAGDPEADLELGVTVPGPETDAIAAAARRAGAFVGLGLLTRRDRTLFDSGLLFDPGGDVALRYERMTPGWRPSRDADPDRYGVGDRCPAAETALGRVAMLLCGDIFDETVTDRAKALSPDLVLVPVSRSFERGGHDTGRWEREEREAYRARAERLATRVLFVNELEPGDRGACPGFGGALVVGPSGEIEGDLPIGRAGILTVVV